MNKFLKSPFAVLFVAVFVSHLLLQFTMWAKAERDPAAKIFWDIFSAPLMYLFASSADRYIWLIVICNSVIWAAVLALIFNYWLMAKGKQSGAAPKT